MNHNSWEALADINGMLYVTENVPLYLILVLPAVPFSTYFHFTIETRLIHPPSV